jgi:hypothetical protein
MSAGAFTPSAHLASLGWHPAVRFVARHSGKSLDVATGDHCEQRTSDDNSHSQVFFLVDAGGGLFNIVHKASGKYLDVSGASTADGAQILLWTPNGGANQKWQLKPTGDGHFIITASHSGKSIDVEGAQTTDGARTFQYSTHGNPNQQWAMVRVNSDTVKIRIGYNGKVLETEHGGNDAKLVQRDDNGNANQKFILRANQEGYYNLTHAASGKAIDVQGNRTDNNAPLLLWDHHGGHNQQFRLLALPNGFYAMLPRNAESTKKAIDVPKDNSSPAALWDYHGEPNQQFRFEFSG